MVNVIVLCSPRLMLGRYSHAVMVGVSKVLSTIEIWIMTAEH